MITVSEVECVYPANIDLQEIGAFCPELLQFCFIVLTSLIFLDSQCTMLNFIIRFPFVISVSFFSLKKLHEMWVLQVLFGDFFLFSVVQSVMK